MTSQIQTQQKSTSKCSPLKINPQWSAQELRDNVRKFGCNGCELGSQKNFLAPVFYRGNPKANKMIVGEAPGLYEDKDGIPFTGPAGQLLDKIWTSVGWDTNTEWYITNVVKCRPVATPGSGKQNKTPLASHRSACRPYIIREINILKPHTVVLVGASAVKALLNLYAPMKNLAGQHMSDNGFPNCTFFIIYHPAALLHAQGQPDRYTFLRQEMWNHIQHLREIIDAKELKQ